MKSDAEIRTEGMRLLIKYMDNLDADRFTTLIQRDRMDYTGWQQRLSKACRAVRSATKPWSSQKKTGRLESPHHPRNR